MPLACGGPDAVENMQWQSVADAKAKGPLGKAGVPHESVMVYLDRMPHLRYS